MLLRLLMRRRHEATRAGGSCPPRPEIVLYPSGYLTEKSNRHHFSSCHLTICIVIVSRLSPPPPPLPKNIFSSKKIPFPLSKKLWLARRAWCADDIIRSRSRSVPLVVYVLVAESERGSWQTDRQIDWVGADVLLGTPYSVDRSEEVVMEGYRTATLDLKRRNRSSVPYADSEDDVRIYILHTFYLLSSFGLFLLLMLLHVITIIMLEWLKGRLLVQVVLVTSIFTMSQMFDSRPIGLLHNRNASCCPNYL